MSIGELMRLTTEIEQDHARRISLLVERSRLRNVSLEALIRELGIGPRRRPDNEDAETAECESAVVHHLRRATFIGEETGGGYYGNNSGPMPVLMLPHSKPSLRLPMYAYWNAVPGYAGTRRGTVPNYPVEMKIADLLRGIDAPLQLALKLTK